MEDEEEDDGRGDVDDDGDESAADVEGEGEYDWCDTCGGDDMDEGKK